VQRASTVLILCLSAATLAWAPATAVAQAQPNQAPAQQAQPKSLGAGGEFGAWSAWEFGDGNNKVCYVTAMPAKSQASNPNAKRGDIRVTVSHRPGTKARDEISFVAGYPLKTDRAVAAAVDKAKTFEFSRRASNANEMIWTKDPETDKAMVAAMRTGKELVMSGTSQRGTTTTDNFVLDGFGKALDAANRACGLR